MSSGSQGSGRRGGSRAGGGGTEEGVRGYGGQKDGNIIYSESGS